MRSIGPGPLIACVLAAVPAATAAHEDPEETVEPTPFAERVEVRARADDLVGIVDSATEGVTGASDLESRPKLRPGEVVETVPGVIATQHSAGGKANQYFLRGFNLDHGTDFRIAVDGVQVNLPTHGHGQGYADLNFLIPELVDTVCYRKGPYYAGVGDFSAAGSSDIDYVHSLDRGRVDLTFGEFDYTRLLAADSYDVGGGTLLGAIEIAGYDGPWERPDDFDKWNGLVTYSRGDRARGFTLGAMAYDGEWNATDQIPRRAVEQGLVSRFGLVDPDLRGASSRYAVSADWRWQVEGSRSALELHVVSHDLELLSNFTYNLDDPSDDTRVDGDQFLQTDDRVFAGARYEYEGPRIGWGAEARYDRIDNGLAGARGGVPDETVRSDSIDQLLGGAWVEARLRPADWLRARIGLRGDLWSADVTSDLDVNSGSETDALVSPKLALAFGPWDRTEAYLNLGLGYHSNDARGATIHVDPRTGDPVEPVDPLVRARGADVGVRTTVLERLHSSLSVFVLEIDSELVFVGDAGGTEASRPGRRTGVELVNHWRPVDWIGVDLDVTLSDAEFTDDDPAGHEIPGAIDTTAAAGVSVERGRFFGGVRWRYFGARPLIEDGSVESSSSSLVNAQVGWNFAHGFTVAIEAFNVLDREENDIEYFYASRLAGEPLEGVEDIHFHPAEPRAVRVVGRYRF